MTINTKIVIIALTAATLLGCEQQSRYQITTKDGVTIKIDNKTGQTYRLNGNSWVEISDVRTEQKIDRFKSANDKIREAYEKMSDEALAQEIENLKGEESAAYIRYFNNKEEGALSDSVNAKQQIEMIKEIQRVRRVQKAVEQ